MQKRTVAGIYLTRRSATVLISRYTHQDVMRETDPLLDPFGYMTETWSPNTPEDAKTKLRNIVKDIADAAQDVHSITIAGYGPFESLKRSEGNYGLVTSSLEDGPFSETNLYDLVREELRECGVPDTVLVTVQTDANAVAIGEAVARDTPAAHVLVSVLATEGVGGGIIAGRSPFKSALHPEMGLLLPRFDRDDALKPERGKRLYGRSVQELASNCAMRARYNLGNETKGASDDYLRTQHESKHWNLRAYYLAQLCFSCTAILAPHSIVVASDIDPRGDLVDEVRRVFQEMRKTRDRDGETMINYPEMRKLNKFIFPLTRLPFDNLRHLEPKLEMTGAVGACVSAAHARRGGRLHEAKKAMA